MFGQPEPIITITATRTNNIQPDQVVISLGVTSGTTVGRHNERPHRTGAGISGTCFTGVSTTSIFASSGNPTPQAALIWSFALTAPLVKLAAVLSQVLSAEQTISWNNPGLTLPSSRGRRQSASNCRKAGLLADAQAQAKQVAAAAGV